MLQQKKGEKERKKNFTNEIKKELKTPLSRYIYVNEPTLHNNVRTYIIFIAKIQNIPNIVIIFVEYSLLGTKNILLEKSSRFGSCIS